MGVIDPTRVTDVKRVRVKHYLANGVLFEYRLRVAIMRGFGLLSQTLCRLSRFTASSLYFV